MKPSPIQIGDRVRINRGIFTGCVGTAISVHDSRVRVKLFTTGAICWCRKKNVTKLSSEPSIPTTHVILNTDPNSKVHPGIQLLPDCELRIRVIHQDHGKPTLDISTVKVTPMVPPPPPVPPLSPFLPIDLRGELFSWLAKQRVTSQNIGQIRESCMVPWDSKWNGMVLDATAAIEEVPTTTQEPPTPAPGASPSPFDPPTNPSQQMPSSSHWKPKSILPANPGNYQVIHWVRKMSAWTNTPYLEYTLRVQTYSGHVIGQWLLPAGNLLVVNNDFSHWLDSEQLASLPPGYDSFSGTVFPAVK